MFRWMKNRATGEILVIMVAVTVCGYVIVNGFILVLLAFFTDRDVSAAARNIADIVNTMIGLLAGYMAGRTDVMAKDQNKKKAEEGGEENA